MKDKEKQEKVSAYNIPRDVFDKAKENCIKTKLILPNTSDSSFIRALVYEKV